MNARSQVKVSHPWKICGRESVHMFLAMSVFALSHPHRQYNTYLVESQFYSRSGERIRISAFSFYPAMVTVYGVMSFGWPDVDENICQ